MVLGLGWIMALATDWFLSLLFKDSEIFSSYHAALPDSHTPFKLCSSRPFPVGQVLLLNNSRGFLTVCGDDLQITSVEGRLNVWEIGTVGKAGV